MSTRAIYPRRVSTPCRGKGIPGAYSYFFGNQPHPVCVGAGSSPGSPPPIPYARTPRGTLPAECLFCFQPLLLCCTVILTRSRIERGGTLHRPAVTDRSGLPRYSAPSCLGKTWAGWLSAGLILPHKVGRGRWFPEPLWDCPWAPMNLRPRCTSQSRGLIAFGGVAGPKCAPYCVLRSNEREDRCAERPLNRPRPQCSRCTR